MHMKSYVSEPNFMKNARHSVMDCFLHISLGAKVHKMLLFCCVSPTLGEQETRDMIANSMHNTHRVTRVELELSRAHTPCALQPL